MNEQRATDALTGLPDAAALMQAIDAAIANDRINRTVSALLRVNLDSFAGFNKWYGEACGDAMLAAVARRLVEAVDNNSTVVRIAPDDFAILLPGMQTPGTVPDIADAIVHDIAYPVIFEGSDYRISASVGIALCRPVSGGGYAFERSAAAVATAKALGGNTIAVAPLV